MMLKFGIERTLANHVSVAYLAYMGEPPLATNGTVFKLRSIVSNDMT